MTVYDWTVTIDGVDVSQFVKAGGTIDSGRGSFFSDFDPPRAVFDVLTPLGWPQYAGTWPTIDYDMPVLIHVTWDGLTQWRRFTGTVQAIDYGVYSHRITCIHPIADLQYLTSPVDISPFYFRSPELDLDRVEWLAANASTPVTVNIVGTQGRYVTRIGEGMQSSAFLPQLLALASDCDARLRGTRLGAIDYRARVWTRPARYTLPAGVVARDSLDMSRERGLIRTAVEVSYGPPDPVTGAQDYVYVPNLELEPIYGDRREQITTQLQYQVGAEGKGNRYLLDHGDVYHAPDVTLIMANASGAQADDILALDDDYPVRLTPLPSSFPLSTYDADVIGFTEVMHEQDYRIILHLSPGTPAGDEDDGNWIEDGLVTGGDETGTYITGGRAWRWHRFTTPGTLTIDPSVSITSRLLVIAGGGDGASGAGAGDSGGGGGSGAVYADDTHPLDALGSPITVTPGGVNTDTVFGFLTVYGGLDGNPPPAAAGGNSGQGGIVPDPGKLHYHLGAPFPGGGQGGGGGGAGSDGSGVYGGSGWSSDLTGTTIVYAKGGQGGGFGVTPVAGDTPGSGGGGGGYFYVGGAAGAGGAVILAYRISPSYSEDALYDDPAILYDGPALYGGGI